MDWQAHIQVTGNEPSLEEFSQMRAANGPRLSFADKQLTVTEKAAALVDFGLADDMQEALGQLVDMGEADQDVAYALSKQLELDDEDSEQI